MSVAGIFSKLVESPKMLECDDVNFHIIGTMESIFISNLRSCALLKDTVTLSGCHDQNCCHWSCNI